MTVASSLQPLPAGMAAGSDDEPAPDEEGKRVPFDLDGTEFVPRWQGTGMILQRP